VSAGLLIVDDEPAIRRLVRGAVERAGFAAFEAATAAVAMAEARRPACVLVLLDLGLPDRDGIELVPLLKAMDRAVIVLTARSDTAEKVAALDLGADDYVVKPFDTDELLARVRAVLRNQGQVVGAQLLTAGVIRIDVPAHVVTLAGEPVPLTRKEFALLVELVRQPGRVVTHRALLTAVWGEAHAGDIEYLRVAVRSLRRKLEPDPARPQLIQNEPGIGYRLLPPNG
jgi:two-component system KDP operon response regulator KdpE